MSEISDFDVDLDALLDQIIALDEDGLLDEPEKPKPVTSLDRMEQGFSEIVEFRREHGRNPDPDCFDIAERRLGARLVGFVADQEKADAVRHLDTEFGLLEPTSVPDSLDDLFSGDFDLGLLDDDPEEQALFDTSSLKLASIEADFGDVAQREKCADFDQYKHLFKQTHQALQDQTMKLVKYSGQNSIKVGRFFVLGGVMAFVAEIGETEIVKQKNAEVPKQRTRIIFENGTESNMYRQSLAIALGKHNGQVVVPTGSLDDVEIFDADIPAGYIYVLRSKTTDPQLTALKDLHKIGFTTQTVEKRVANAAKDPTFLMAPVEIVATYKVYNIKPSAIENLLHHFFGAVRLNLRQVGLDGQSHEPGEWFTVPLKVIDQAIEMLVNGQVKGHYYNPETQQFEIS